MYLNKKSQFSEKALIAIILIIIFMAVGFVFQDKLFKWQESKNPKDICKASVYKAHLSKIPGMKFTDDINCPTINLTISDKEKSVVEYKLANSMYDCYDQFWQGKYELFGGEGVTQYCIICNIIKFDKNMTIPLPEFKTYLHNTYIEGMNITYENFLAGYTTNQDELNGYSSNIDTISYNIETKYQYTTIFTYLRKNYVGKLENTEIGIGIGTLAGLITGVVLIPLTGGSSIIVAVLTVGGGVGGGMIGYNAGSDVNQDWKSAITLIPYNSTALRELGCMELPASQVKSSTAK